jgi:hypothetical protein
VHFQTFMRVVVCLPEAIVSGRGWCFPPVSTPCPVPCHHRRSLVTLLLVSVFTVGLLDRTLLVVGRGALDRPYGAFLAGINLAVSELGGGRGLGGCLAKLLSKI